MHNVFISYSHSDTKIASAVLNILEKNGIRCWIDYRDAEPGLNYAASIIQAIKSCNVAILIVSEKSNNSPHVINEINSCVNASKLIIPLKIDNYKLSDSFEYYIGKTHWIDAITPPLEAHIEKLSSTVSAFLESSSSNNPPLDKPEVKPNGPCTYRMAKFGELLQLGYTSKSIATQLVENDYINCNGIQEENEGTAEQWEEYLENDSDTFQYLIDKNNSIVGDWSMVALTTDAMELAKEGKLLERDIGIDNTDILCFPGEYNGYILTFSLLPNHRNASNYNLLIRSWLNQICEYAKNGIFFTGWCMNVFGREVEALIRQLGFKYACNNVGIGKIYTCSNKSLFSISLMKEFSELKQLYEEHFDEKY